MNFNPKISIVIPVYNGSNFLGEAIDCALSQTYNNFEVIVVNDGSTDGGATEEIALSYGDKIRYFKKENGGVSSALNYGIKVMEGEYFSWLSHDDKYTPYKLENSVKALSAFEKKDKILAYSGGNLINESGEAVKPFSINFPTDRLTLSEELLLCSASGNTLNGCALLIPKSAFEEFGLFDESLRYSQDIFMWYKMFLGGYSVIYTGEADVMYRIHSSQTSQTRKDLFAKDSLFVAQEITPKLVEWGGEILYCFAKRNAIMRNTEVVKLCRRVAKEKKPFSLFKRIKLRIFGFYGKFRGTIKKVYYRLILRVKI